MPIVIIFTANVFVCDCLRVPRVYVSVCLYHDCFCGSTYLCRCNRHNTKALRSTVNNERLKMSEIREKKKIKNKLRIDHKKISFKRKIFYTLLDSRQGLSQKNFIFVK